MAFFVYLLECSDGSLYCGSTNNLEKRVKQHNSGKASKYTRARLPAQLVYFEEKKTRKEALKREAEIKGMGRSSKKELLVKKNQ